MYDVTALGELLIDFTPKGISENGQKLYELNPGGAPANVLAALNKMGANTAFIGKVGDDIHGRFLKDTLEDARIDTTGLIIDSNVFTTLAFVEIDEYGDRNFSFARKPGADIMLRVEEVNQKLIKESKIFHIGSLSLTDEPSRSATLHALQAAKEAGCIISYDPNYRAPLWESKEKAIDNMKSVLPLVDVIKLSEEETDLITPYKDPVKAAQYLVNAGGKLVTVTLGSKGAYCYHQKGGCTVPGYKSKVIDTTGAGDSFFGGFLYCISRCGKSLVEITLEDMIEFTRFGNAAASLCVEKYGGIPGMPSMEEIIKRKKLLS